MKKKALIILTIILFSQNSFSQACGIYRVKLIGKLNTNIINPKRIKVPTISFFHNSEKENPDSFTEVVIQNNEFIRELNSRLTSELFDDAESLKKFYISKKQNFPLTIYLLENGVEKEIYIEIEWKNIIITRIEDKGFGNYFEINLKEINIL